MKRILMNETGQMSVFVALIFQVLFVFFAMVVNVGMVVHDKINLQNAVDLGAYYAAQKQADLLNEIAHVNYQIRQDYKLLAWRYRVLGTLGRQNRGAAQRPDEFVPARSVPMPLTDSQWNPLLNFPNLGGDGRTKEIPSICVANNMWSDFVGSSTEEENYCFKRYGEAQPLVAQVTNFAGSFIPLVNQLQSSAALSRAAQLRSCAGASVLNWQFTMLMFYAYKLSIASRKILMKDLRTNLVAQDFTDRSASPVREGVAKTVKKNLTTTNLSTFDDGYFQVVNGLSNPSCAGVDNDGEPVLPEIQTAPMMFYVGSGDEGSLNACTTFQAAFDRFERLNAAQMEARDPGGLMRNLTHEPDPKDPHYSSLGFEKNPWCMAYVGVRAKTKPRKPFAPLGQPVTLEARAFAQPFGGRVGPWYMSRWPQGSPISNAGNRTDLLTSPRSVNGAILGSAAPTNRLPNYSRYPGDALGLESQVTLGAQRLMFQRYASANVRDRLRFDFYTGLDRTPVHGDPLAWDSGENVPQDGVSPRVRELRKAEIAAVTPDLFDAIYYSIDPQYALNYLRVPQADARFPAHMLYGLRISRFPDIGGRNGVPGLAEFSVKNQIQDSIGVEGSAGGFDPTLLADQLNYPIREWEHLLTGWGSEKAQTFTFPDSRFGKCEKAAPLSVMIPGGCATGGRVGYSVRFLSRDYLLSSKWQIGGEQEAPGPILNPPDPSF